MKKIILPAFLFLGVLFLAGCAQKPAGIPNVSEKSKDAASAPEGQILPSNIAPIPVDFRGGELSENKQNNEMFAKKALESFFANLSEKNYVRALAYLQLLDKNTPETLSIGDKLEESWENYESFSQIADKSDRAKLLEDYCSHWDTCLPAKIISTKKISDEDYQISVQFTKPDGKKYEGTHLYPVKKFNGLWYVARGPLYHP